MSVSKLLQNKGTKNGIVPKHESSEPIAIVGMSCRYPKAKNLQEFWEVLVNGVDATGTIPLGRWGQQDYPYKLPGACNSMNAGFLNVSVDKFDAPFFGISPKEATFMDPQTRLLLELVWEGLEDAAIDPHGLKGTHGGVFVGSWLSDYKDILLQCPGYGEDFYRRYMGNSIGSAAARISFLLGMTGPSIASESGCSSAMVAVHMACKSLQRGECGMALACGVNLLLKPFEKSEMAVMLSPDGHCKTFDEKADGFARAEGVGVLVLKRVSDAVKDGDRIWGVLKGSAITQEGLSKSMGTPTIHSESLAMELALEDAGIQDPAQVSYVETHGTGTKVGDPMEIKAIEKAYQSKNRKENLLIGSVKTNVGHTESCSGITGIMKVVLAMEHDSIPPHIHLKNLNPAINLIAIPASIPLEITPWKRNGDGTPRLAGISSFGITGTDAHVILEEPPKKISTNLGGKDDKILERPFHILKLSAKSAEALDVLLTQYSEHCRDSDDTLANIAYTANTGRASFINKAVVIARSKEEMVMCIEDGNILRSELSSSTSGGKICFLFTGQGSQYPGMGKQLYESSPVFRKHFDHCSNLLKNNYDLDIKSVLWGSSRSTEISRTIYSQTGIFCVEYALLQLWTSWGIKPDAVLGHSLGEFTAAVCAGILKVEDAIKLIAKRSRLIDALPEGKMLVVLADHDTVTKVMVNSGISLDFAAFNSPTQTVVSGDSEDVLQFSKSLKDNFSVDSIILKSTHAFHSKHMDPILKEYSQIASTIERVTSLQCDFISGVKGGVINDANDFDPSYWVKHTRDPVSFIEACKKAVDQCRCEIFLEVGPHPVLTSLAATNLTEKMKEITWLPSLKRGLEEWPILFQSLAKLCVKGVPINWKGIDWGYSRQKVSIPHYPFMGKKYWPKISTKNGGQYGMTASRDHHPLLGREIENASSNMKIFHNYLHLGEGSDSRVKFIQDHKIGQRVIFPGAGYLEICVSAVFNAASFTGGRGILEVHNLKIEAPLALLIQEGEDEGVFMQTLLERTKNDKTEDTNDKSNCLKYLVRICKKVDSSDHNSKCRWITHATASVNIPMNFHCTKDSSNNLDSGLIDKLRNFEGNSMTLFYERLSVAGLYFGDNFRSIEKYWSFEALEETGSQKKLLVKLKVRAKDSNDVGDYSAGMHTTVTDAMLQAIMMFSNDRLLNAGNHRKTGLYVPVKIGKFTTWFGGAQGKSENVDWEGRLFILVSSKDSSEGEPTISAQLLNSKGKIICEMSSVLFVETTVASIEAVVKDQDKQGEMPDLWEEKWVPRPVESPFLNRVDLEASKGFWNCEEFHSKVKSAIGPAPQEVLEKDQNLLDLVYLYVSGALDKLGWKPKVGQVYTEEELVTTLNISDKYLNYFTFMLEILEERGILRKDKDIEKTWKLIGNPAQQEIVLGRMEDIESRVQIMIPLISNIGRELSAILKGQASPLTLMFPENGDGGVTLFYETHTNFYAVQEITRALVQEQFKYLKKIERNHKSVLRILEVGAGTGVYTKHILDCLIASNLDYEYHYTDISSSFFAAAEKRFAKFGDKIKFRKLNIEEDPLEQGFFPEYYDILFAFEVVHATRNIAESLENCKLLLRPGGMLDLWETTREGANFLTYLFGLLPGYWRFEDKELRDRRCFMNTHKWERILGKCGFEWKVSIPTYLETHSLICCLKKNAKKILPQPPPMLLNKVQKTWLVFQDDKLCSKLRIKLKSLGRHVILAPELAKDDAPLESQIREVLQLIMKDKYILLEGIIYGLSYNKTNSQNEVLKPFFYLTKNIHLLEEKGRGSGPIRIIVLTQGTVPLEGNDMSYYHSSTLWGYCRSFMNEMSNLVQCRCIDMGNGVSKVENENEVVSQVIYELFINDRLETHVAYWGNMKHTPKLQLMNSSKPSHDTELQLPKMSPDRFQLILPSSKSIADLQFGPLEERSFAANQVEIRVKCVALNFRDILSVLKPTMQFEKMNTVGLDVVGEVVKVGDKVTQWKLGDFVIGLNMKDDGPALPSHLAFDENLVVGVPKNMTLCEAVTLPAVFATAYKCLIEEAGLRKTDTVLLHTASGGVGLIAIELCRQVVPMENIICTAGSKRKRDYLRGLGIQHIYNSRDTKYLEEILKLTNGQGVDVVLNSLTSEGFKEATLKACAKNSRFIEMSKLNVWSGEEVKTMRSDVDYRIVDVSSVNTEEMCHLLGMLREYLEKNLVKALPYVRFDGVRVRQAMQFFQKAKHIGKVVLVMPDRKLDDTGMLVVTTPLFNERSTYLVTGGLGGIGLEVGKWMVEKGAKYVVLASRGLPSREAAEEIKKMNGKLIAIQLDVSCYEDVRKVVKEDFGDMGLPPLRGIMHAAGSLADGFISKQDWPKLSSTLKTKVDGTLNLHRVTLELNLEHFVLFSSFVAQLGTPGQSNHAAGNQFEDVFAHYRHSIGFPATTVNWGVWAQVGVATNVEFSSLRPITTCQGLAVLDHVLRTNQLQIMATTVKHLELMKNIFPRLYHILDERFLKSQDACKSNELGVTFSGRLNLSSADFWEQYNVKGNDIKEKVRLIKQQVQIVLGHVLKLPSDDPSLTDHTDFESMGVDSLMFVEIKNALQTLFGSRVNITESLLRDNNTIGLISESLVSQIEDGEMNGKKDNLVDKSFSIEDRNKLIRKDCHLPETISPGKSCTLTPLHQVQTVLLTGCTGILGPFVLREVFRRWGVTKVICLLKKRSLVVNGTQRLRQILRERGLEGEVPLDKVEFVEGDVAKSKLGLVGATWDNLTNKVDAVFHCAALVSHLERYRESNSETDVRAVNIGGLRNILEFAATGNKLKHVFHAGSFNSYLAEHGTAELVEKERWPSVDDLGSITEMVKAYPMSKICQEVLLKQAVERGIPCKAFRFTILTGPGVSPRKSHVMQKYMFSLKSGMIPDHPFPLLVLPVDKCAEVAVKLFFSSECPNEPVNVAHPNPDLEQKFVEIAKEKFHKSLKLVEFSEFVKALNMNVNQAGNSSELVHFQELYQDQGDTKAYTDNPFINKWLDNGMKSDVWKSDKISKLAPEFYESLESNMEYLCRDLEKALQQ